MPAKNKTSKAVTDYWHFISDHKKSKQWSKFRAWYKEQSTKAVPGFKQRVTDEHVQFLINNRVKAENFFRKDKVIAKKTKLDIAPIWDFLSHLRKTKTINDKFITWYQKTIGRAIPNAQKRVNNYDVELFNNKKKWAKGLKLLGLSESKLPNKDKDPEDPEEDAPDEEEEDAPDPEEEEEEEEEDAPDPEEEEEEDAPEPEEEEEDEDEDEEEEDEAEAEDEEAAEAEAAEAAEAEEIVPKKGEKLYRDIITPAT